MSIVYLASTFEKGLNDTFKRMADNANDAPLDLLVAYPYLDKFLKVRSQFRINSWVLDSGAFSAFNSGKVIDLKQYTKDARALEGDLTDYFALDVIGDFRKGLVNYEHMLSEGARPIPVYHPGEPWRVLDILKATAHKIAIGSGRDLSDKGTSVRGSAREYVEQVFARAWPKRIHGLALSRAGMMDLFPFDSVDSTTWIIMPGYGRYLTYAQKTTYIPVQRGKLLDNQVRLMQRRSRKYAQIWRKELAIARAVPAPHTTLNSRQLVAVCKGKKP